jgi:hypothetical protein
VAVELVTCAVTPLKVTAFPLEFESNPVPLIVTGVPAIPLDGVRDVTYGGVTVRLVSAEGEMFVIEFG